MWNYEDRKPLAVSLDLPHTRFPNGAGDLLDFAYEVVVALDHLELIVDEDW